MARKNPKTIRACAGKAFDELAKALCQVPKTEMEHQQKLYDRRKAQRKKKR